jgi:transcription antitermination factor NusG
MATKWYVLRSKPHREDALSRYAGEHSHEIFYPRLRASPVNPRARKVRPYFPGYLFVHADLEQVGHSTFHWMPFSQGLVHVGGEPAPVAEAAVNAIQARVAEIWRSGGQQLDRLRRGDPVLIRAGSFAGYEGIFDYRLPGRDRVRILLKMVTDRFVPAELDVGLVEKLDRRR